MKKTVVYPGTFDPLTVGHYDLVERSSSVFDRVVVAVAAYTSKATAMFSLEERLEMARLACAKFGNVSVEPLDMLLVHFCHKHDARVVIRGMRVYSDFEYEFQMALTNRQLAPDIETLFMMPPEEHSYITASVVREIARYGGDTHAFVPPEVQEFIKTWQKNNRPATVRDDSIGAFDR